MFTQRICTSRRANTVLIGFLLVWCVGSWLVVPWCPRLWAHEHTWAAYADSLGLPAHGHDESGESSEAAGHEPVAELALKLVDADDGRPMDGLVRIRRADGSVVKLENLTNRGTMLRQGHPGRDWYVVPGSATVAVPQEKLVVDAFSGVETELATETLNLAGTAKASRTVALRRFHDSRAAGWHNGNTHLHLRSLTRQEADRYLQSIARADRLELVFVSYLRRAKAEETYISNRYTRHELNRLSGHGVLFDSGQEHRHNFGPGGEGYGHVMFLNLRKLIRPGSIGPGIMGQGTDWPSVRRGIDLAHREGATAVWCHNAWGLEDVPNWVTGALDAHNIFDGGSRGDYAQSYYRFMDVGLRVPFSTGTDWFIYDFSRVYVKTDQPLTVPGWLDALRRGRSFITNGPLLEFEVDGHEPGDVIQLPKPGALTVRGQARGRCDFQEVQLVHNGRVISTAPSRPVDGHFQAKMTSSVRMDRPGWLAMRIRCERTNEMGEELFGHTSAVYVELAGKTIFKPEAAELLIADMLQAVATIDQKAKFSGEPQRKEVLDVYREGIRVLRARLDGS